MKILILYLLSKYVLTYWIPITLGDPCFSVIHICLVSNAGRTNRPVVFGLRLLKTYDRGSLSAQKFREKVYRDS